MSHWTALNGVGLCECEFPIFFKDRNTCCILSFQSMGTGDNGQTIHRVQSHVGLVSAFEGGTVITPAPNMMEWNVREQIVIPLKDAILYLVQVCAGF